MPYEIESGFSSTNPERLNIVVIGPTFDECQRGIWQVMEEHGRATFTLPAKDAEGCWVAIGHAAKC